MTQSFKSAPSIFTEQPAQDKEATNDDNISDILKDLAEMNTKSNTTDYSRQLLGSICVSTEYCSV